LISILVAMTANRVPPQAYFVISAVFHYLGPAFAVLLFAHVAPLGVAWLRIMAAALVFAAWRRPWRVLSTMDWTQRRLLLALGLTLAGMNCVFYLAIDRLPLATVGAIEFLGPIALAAIGLFRLTGSAPLVPRSVVASRRPFSFGSAPLVPRSVVASRWVRNVGALVLAIGGVALLTEVRLTGEPLGFALAFANCALFVAYIVLGKRIARDGGAAGIDRLALAMMVAAVAAAPVGLLDAATTFTRPDLLAAGIGVGICSSVIPYVCDQLALARLSRATFALMLSLLPATATVVGLVVLAQRPGPGELLGIALVIGGVALHDASGSHPPRPTGGDRDDVRDVVATRPMIATTLATLSRS
jgi:inner membrane transporter RhtA